ncbi:MAG: TIGR03086 family metal-binding protein [Acidimicrobiales bacterium]
MTTNDRRPALVRSYDNAAEIVAGVTEEQLSGPTPCADYDVAALVDHIVGAGWRAARLGKGETPSGEEFPHVQLVVAADELCRAGKEAAAAWADDGRLSEQVTMPWGEVYTGATLVDMYLAELAAHAWDLAAATAQLDRLDPGLAAVALDGARAMLKPEYRDMIGVGNPFGAEVEAPVDAGDWDRLAAFMGRTP